jgi:hypothetical protein
MIQIQFQGFKGLEVEARTGESESFRLSDVKTCPVILIALLSLTRSRRDDTLNHG